MSRRANADAGVDFFRGTVLGGLPRSVRGLRLGFTHHLLSNSAIFIPHPRGARWRRRRGTPPPLKLLILARRVQTVLNPGPFVSALSSHFCDRCDLNPVLHIQKSRVRPPPLTLPLRFLTFRSLTPSRGFPAFLKLNENVTYLFPGQG